VGKYSKLQFVVHASIPTSCQFYYLLLINHQQTVNCFSLLYIFIDSLSTYCTNKFATNSQQIELMELLAVAYSNTGVYHHKCEQQVSTDIEMEIK